MHKAFHVRSGEIVAIKKAKETVADRDVGGTVPERSGMEAKPCIFVGNL